MKSIATYIPTLALVALCMVSFSALAAGDAGGLSTDVQSTLKSYFDMVFSWIPYIAALVLLGTLLSMKWIGVGATIWVLVGCVLIGSIALIINSTGLSFA